MKNASLYRRAFLTLGSVASVALWISMAVSPANAQGAVSLNNVTHPYVAIEVGNTAEVRIVNASGIGEVTFTVNGGGPFFAGYTDGNGNFSLYVTMSAGDIGDYEEHWYVDGNEVTPTGYSPYFGIYRPRLPFFHIWENIGQNCPGNQITKSQCGGTVDQQHRWIHQPVTFASTSGIADPAMVYAAANNWNAIQSPGKVYYSDDISGHWDLTVRDQALPTFVYGATLIYAVEFCNPTCVNRILDCNGACIRAGTINWSEVVLNVGEIQNFASAWGLTPNTAATFTVRHEMGHALGVGHSVPVTPACSAVQAILYPTIEGIVGCGISAATGCDANGINTVYPVGPGYCPTNVNTFCTTAC